MLRKKEKVEQDKYGRVALMVKETLTKTYKEVREVTGSIPSRGNSQCKVPKA